ncbi:MAG: hypothetical protein UMS36scaffold28_14 [Phage 59_13]|nr:MAG: hypothetical protein UMS36scaffold28_14 [Phage 59_13]
MSLQTDLEAQLAAINAAITAAIAAGPGMSWRIGQVQFDSGSMINSLFAQQKAIMDALAAIPSEVIDTVGFGVGPLGNDNSEYVNEDF